ncbi:hypothetical protein [Burkholderia cenocepacia]|uniref:hypothetical protein n=1 Tax=Burkholderia cenocepacia TaxID=95486 RepID=UPI001ED8E22E|nr:hypothetical protein [Burkholderia cenocepacia]
MLAPAEGIPRQKKNTSAPATACATTKNATQPSQPQRFHAGTHGPRFAVVPVQSKYAGKATIEFHELVEENFVTFPAGYGSALNAALEDPLIQKRASNRSEANRRVALLDAVSADIAWRIGRERRIQRNGDHVSGKPIVDVALSICSGPPAGGHRPSA